MLYHNELGVLFCAHTSTLYRILVIFLCETNVTLDFNTNKVNRFICICDN